jgi:hypothetical protein
MRGDVNAFLSSGGAEELPRFLLADAQDRV